jgi:hypothetical protein
MFHIDLDLFQYENISHVAATNNPTFMEHEDGGLTFLLSCNSIKYMNSKPPF